MIYVVRNQQVMIDSDLAMLYQVETKALNRAVKRNIRRFPEDFCFQLAKEEYEGLKCQIGTSKIVETEKTDGRGGRRTLPYVFTEQGISMLASVLHSEVAVNVSIGIMRAFVEMRRFMANNALLFERISNVELKQLEYQKQTDAKLKNRNQRNVITKNMALYKIRSDRIRTYQFSTEKCAERDFFQLLNSRCANG